MRITGFRLVLLVWSMVFFSLTPTLSFAQTSNSSLSAQEVAQLRQQNDAFLKVTSDALPVLNKRLSRQELRLTQLLDQVSTAQKNNDAVLAAKLATQLGEVDADVTRLHAAQLDMRKLTNVSAKVAGDSSKQDPGGQVCNGKSCAAVPAFEAIIVILTAGLADELNKKQPFGPNNEIMKGLHAVGDFVQCIFGCK